MTRSAIARGWMRWLGACGALAFAVFFGALLVGMFGAEVDGPPIYRWLLLGFIVPVFGALCIAGLVTAFSLVRGDRARQHAPRALTEICPGCGGPAPVAARCDVCEHPPASELPVRWLGAPHGTVLGTLFGAAIFSGVLCLGLFLLAGIFHGEETRWWAIAAFVGLAALLIVVGVVGAIGGLAMVAKGLREVPRYTLAYNAGFRGREGTHGASTVASAVAGRGRLIHAAGTTRIARPLDLDVGGRDPDAEPSDVAARHALALVLARMHARGAIDLWSETRIEWSTGTMPPPPPSRRVREPEAGAPTYRVHDELLVELREDAARAGIDEPTRCVVRALVRRVGMDLPSTVSGVWHTLRAERDALEKLTVLDEARLIAGPAADVRIEAVLRRALASVK